MSKSKKNSPYPEGYTGMMPGAVKQDLKNSNSFTEGSYQRGQDLRRKQWAGSSTSLNDVFPSDRQPW